VIEYSFSPSDSENGVLGKRLKGSIDRVLRYH